MKIVLDWSTGMATSQNLATKLALRWGILPVGTLVFRGLNDISNLLITVQAAEASRPCNSMNDDTSPAIAWTTIPVKKKINRFSIFYCCVIGNDKRKYNWIEAQAWLLQRIFATKTALKWHEGLDWIGL